MKIKPEDATVIIEAVSELDSEARREVYRLGRFPRAALVRDLDKRYRWDLWWEARNSGLPAMNEVIRSLPMDVLDSHIDTVLRKAVAPL